MTETPRSAGATPDAREDAPLHAAQDRDGVRRTIAWLEGEFPGWSFSVDETATWEGDLRPLWIARREGHHPQAELSAAKLHTRLSDHLARQERRKALGN